MPQTDKEKALALIPEASLDVLQRQLVQSRGWVPTYSLLCPRFKSDGRVEAEFHQWLIPLVEAEIKKREAPDAD